MVKVVTGGHGLVGSHFAEDYIKLGRNDAELTDAAATHALFNSLKPHTVIHCAAKVGGLYSNMQAEADYFEQNISINSNVLAACRKAGVKRLVAFLSTCIFPADVQYPLTEEKIHLGPPHHSNYGYSYAKRMLEVAIRACNEQYGTQYFCVIPTNIYGPHDNFNLTHAHVIPALVHKIYLARQNNTTLQVPGDGSALREFVFAHDVARIVEQLSESYTQTGPLIISSGQEISIKDLVNLLAQLMQFKGKIEWQTQFSNGQHRKPADITRLKSVLPGLSLTSIESGLKQTIAWFVANYQLARK